VFKEISDLTDPDNYEKDNTNNTPDND